MSQLLLNIFLAIIWAAIVGDISIKTLGVGFLLGYLVILLIKPILGPSRYTIRIWEVVGLFLYFLKDLVLSSLIVARDVLRPGFHMHSGVIAIPLDAETDIEITILANMISLTPGTLSLDVSEDHKTLYVHAMYLDPDDIDKAARDIKQGLERHLLQVLR